MNSDTTTKFKGDIIFNDGEKDILVSDLATVTEVNDALTKYVNADKIDTFDKIFISDPSGPVLDNAFVYDDSHVMSSKVVKELIDQLTKRISDLESHHNGGEPEEPADTTYPYEPPDYSGWLRLANNDVFNDQSNDAFADVHLYLDEGTNDLVISGLPELVDTIGIHHFAFGFKDDLDRDHLIEIKLEDDTYKSYLDNDYFCEEVYDYTDMHVVNYSYFTDRNMSIPSIEENAIPLLSYRLLQDYLDQINLQSYEELPTDEEWKAYDFNTDYADISFQFCAEPWKPFEGYEDILLLYNTETDTPIALLTATKEYSDDYGANVVLFNNELIPSYAFVSSEPDIFDMISITVEKPITWFTNKYPDPSMLTVKLFRKNAV